jgi:hypothetical protein
MSSSVRQLRAARECQREEQEQIINSAVGRVAQAERALTAKQNEVAKEFWGRPIAEVRFTTKDEYMVDAGADEGLTVAINADPVDRNKASAALAKFYEKLSAKGFTLSEDGKLRLRNYLSHQRTARNIDLHDVQTYVNSFDRLYRLDCFGDEVGWSADLVQSEPTPAQEPEPQEKTESFEEALQTRDGTTREGSQKLRVLAEQAGVSSVYIPIFLEWLDSMEKHFGFVSTEAQRKAALRYMQEHNYSFTHGPHYDATRRALGKIGIFPLMLTEDERLAERLENTPNLSGSYLARQEYKNEKARLMGGL